MGRKREYVTATERKRAQRARDRAARVYRLDAPTPAVVAVVDHTDPVGALAEWSRKKADRPAWTSANWCSAGAAAVCRRLAAGHVEHAQISTQHGQKEREERNLCDRVVRRDRVQYRDLCGPHDNADPHDAHHARLGGVDTPHDAQWRDVPPSNEQLKPDPPPAPPPKATLPKE